MNKKTTTGYALVFILCIAIFGFIAGYMTPHTNKELKDCKETLNNCREDFKLISDMPEECTATCICKYPEINKTEVIR